MDSHAVTSESKNVLVLYFSDALLRTDAHLSCYFVGLGIVPWSEFAHTCMRKLEGAKFEHFPIAYFAAHAQRQRQRQRQRQKQRQRQRQRQRPATTGKVGYSRLK